MRTTKATTGYDRLVPETKIERGLISAVICGALDGKEIRVQHHTSPGMINVRDEWDGEGRIKVVATVPVLLDSQKTYTFQAWVEDHDGGVWVAWEGASAPFFAGGRPSTQANYAPSLPALTVADLT